MSKKLRAIMEKVTPPSVNIARIPVPMPTLLDLCAYWFFFSIFVNMMIFHIKTKNIKIGPQSYVRTYTYRTNSKFLFFNQGTTLSHLQRISLNVTRLPYVHNCGFPLFRSIMSLLCLIYCRYSTVRVRK